MTTVSITLLSPIPSTVIPIPASPMFSVAVLSTSISISFPITVLWISFHTVIPESFFIRGDVGVGFGDIDISFYPAARISIIRSVI